MDAGAQQFPPTLVHADLLLTMLDDVTGAEGVWSESEMSDLWQHQMQAKLVDDLGSGDPVGGVIVARLGESVAPSIHTFIELFQHNSPPAELLRRVKDFAKHEAMGSSASLPRSISSGLYHTAILVAKVRSDASVSMLPDAKLTDAVRWLISRMWVDESMRSTLITLLAQLSSGSGEAEQASFKDGLDTTF